MFKGSEGVSALRRSSSLATRFFAFTLVLLFWVVAVVLGFDWQMGTLSWGKGALLIVVCALSAGLISRVTLRLMVRPMALLEQGMQSVGEGRLEPLQISRTGDEIQRLGETFNNMIKALAASQAEIQRHQEHLEERIRQRTEDLEEAMQRALAASQAKSEFLANMSHELRTPMNGVLGMVDLVLASELNSEQRDQLETAQRSAMSLLALLNDLLDLSKIEAGRMSLEKIPFDLRRLIDDTVDAQRPKAWEKGLSLTVEYAPALAASVQGDPLRLRQIITNLLSNALKFTEKGSVRLRAATRRDGEQSWVLDLSIADTGTGIPADKLPLIFQKFTQVDGSITRRYGGTGLGLAITRKLVELHGGRVWVESTMGKGSTFFVTVSVGVVEGKGGRKEKPAPAVQRPAPQPAPKLTGRVLVVEDNLVNQKVVTTILRKQGLAVEVANNGQEALERLEGADVRGEPFSVVLMDVQMPVMNGFDATRRIREDSRWCNLPVLAMTACAMIGDREKCLAAGMTDYISKPVHSDHLVRTVLGLLAGNQSAGAPPVSQQGHIDPELTTRLTGDDTSVMVGMVHLFLQLAPERLGQLDRAARSNDLESLGKECRRLHDAAERIQASPVVECTSRIARAATGGDTTAVRHGLLLLEAELQRLRRTADHQPETTR